MCDLFTVLTGSAEGNWLHPAGQAWRGGASWRLPRQSKFAGLIGLKQRVKSPGETFVHYDL